MKTDVGTPGRILVIETDPGVRAFVARVLREAGYEVATRGSIANASAGVPCEAFDLVILNASQSNRRNQAQLASEATLLWKAPVLIISGRTFANEAVRQKGFILLSKPFRPADLLKAVQTATR